ncbi:MAG: VOC family protein [Mariprofundaceae bacterium]|nr:VOC family protein [Mariprofundaceae bacterium]
MEITLNHTIIPSFNNVESAKFYEHIFGFEFVKEWGHFAVVKVSSTLTLDFQTKKAFSSIHYAFKVSDEQFDQIFARIQNSAIAYGSEPYDLENGQINHKYGGRGVYFKDPNAHVLEIITTDYIID